MAISIRSMAGIVANSYLDVFGLYTETIRKTCKGLTLKGFNALRLEAMESFSPLLTDCVGNWLEVEAEAQRQLRDLAPEIVKVANKFRRYLVK